jgi:hypothetical protein
MEKKVDDCAKVCLPFLITHSSDDSCLDQSMNRKHFILLRLLNEPGLEQTLFCVENPVRWSVLQPPTLYTKGLLHLIL